MTDLFSDLELEMAVTILEEKGFREIRFFKHGKQVGIGAIPSGGYDELAMFSPTLYESLHCLVEMGRIAEEKSQ